MNIIILDDYQDAVRKLHCAATLEPYNAKVFTNTVKGIGQLSVRLRDADVLVLIRERTHFPAPLLEKLPRLKLISQTGRSGSHIDLDACTRLGIAVAEGVGSPVAPAELTWALIMAAMRRLPQYIGNLKHGAWQQSGLKSASMPPNFGLGLVLKGARWASGATARSASWWPATAAPSACRCRCGAAKPRAHAPWPTACTPRQPPGLLREQRRAERAPAPERRHPRHRHGWKTCRA
jgi:hypothetical protein